MPNWVGFLKEELLG